MREWIPLDPDNLPTEADVGPFLVTNNVTARNRFGWPSHVWLCCTMVHRAVGGDLYILNGATGDVRSLTHYMPIFARKET